MKKVICRFPGGNTGPNFPLKLSLSEAAKYSGVTRKVLSELINSHSSLSTEMSVRIAKATNSSPESWLNMQTNLDRLEVELKKCIVRNKI